jgi:hypothetical protein
MWKAFNSLFPLSTPLSEILPPAGQQGSVANSSPRGTHSEWSLLGVCQPSISGVTTTAHSRFRVREQRVAVRGPFRQRGEHPFQLSR